MFLAIAAYIIHLFTFSPMFEEASKRRFNYYLLILNALPYIPAVSAMPLPLLAYLITLTAVVFSIAAGGRIRTPVGYVAGLALYSSLALPMRYLLGTPTHVEMLFYSLYIVYFVTFALYVESRLAFRSVDPSAPLLFWTPLVSYISISHPPYLIALVEPTWLLIQNYRHNAKVSTISDIRKMGRRVLASSVLFTALAIAAASAGVRLIP